MTPQDANFYLMVLTILPMVVFFFPFIFIEWLGSRDEAKARRKCRVIWCKLPHTNGVHCPYHIGNCIRLEAEQLARDKQWRDWGMTP